MRRIWRANEHMRGSRERHAMAQLTIPAGDKAETFEREKVERLLQEAAYLSILSVPVPEQKNRPIFVPWSPGVPIAVDVNENLHRFPIRVGRKGSSQKDY